MQHHYLLRTLNLTAKTAPNVVYCPESGVVVELLPFVIL